MSIPLAGAKVRAADLAGIFPTNVDAWTTWVPVLTQGGGAIAHTVQTARYNKRDGRTVDFQLYLSVTGAGIANNRVLVTLPVAASAGALSAGICGSLYLYDASAVIQYIGASSILNTSTQVGGYVSGTSTAVGQTGGGFAAALAAGDLVILSGTYESAS